MKIKTQDLQGAALDWAVALAAGYDEGWLRRQLQNPNPATRAIPRLSSDWAEAGPLIEKLDINIQRRTHAETTERGQEIYRKNGWTASTTPTAYWMTPVRAFGTTPLEAAMRCYIAKEIGEEVEVPDALCAEVKTAAPNATYDIARIAWELNQTALGNAHYGNALRVAKEMPGVTSEDRSLLDRFATGNHSGTDHVGLQDLASRLTQSADDRTQERAHESPRAPLMAAQRHGLVAALREAAAILAEIKPGTEPANMRWPLADELEGFAHMLDDSTQDQSDADGEANRPTGG